MDQTTTKIIRRLAKRHPRELIITDLTARFRLTRSDAEQLVNDIEKKHRYAIENRRRPILILSWSALALGGLTLLISGCIGALTGSPTPSAGNLILILIGVVAAGAGFWEVNRMVRKPK